ncbi:MAG: PqqD family protein [bacterium]
MELSSTITRTQTCMVAPMENELVVVSLASNEYVALNEIGRVIWEMLETPQRVETLCAQLAEKYAASPELIYADILPFLQELQDVSLIEVTAADAL